MCEQFNNEGREIFGKGSLESDCKGTGSNSGREKEISESHSSDYYSSETNNTTVDLTGNKNTHCCMYDMHYNLMASNEFGDYSLL